MDCFVFYVVPSSARRLLLPMALGCLVTCSLRSFSSDRSNTLNRSSFARDSMMIEEILAPTKDTVSWFVPHPQLCVFLFSVFVEDQLVHSPLLFDCSL